MSFGTLLRNENDNFVRTENGAAAMKSTLDHCLDLFAVIGALRGQDHNRIETLFENAFRQDALLAMKILFYARDIREGLGEREVFRTLLVYLANNHKEVLIKNLDLVGFYGRYDDWYCLIGTPAENEMWDVMKSQFERDLLNLEKGKDISLLAKWIKTADASSKTTKSLGILTAQKLGYDVYTFKRLVRKMRKYLDVVEVKMTANCWEDIAYNKVPGRAMLVYRNAFLRHDRIGFCRYLDNVTNHTETIHSQTLYPYDIIENILYRDGSSDESRDVLQLQWENLPNYVEEGTNAIVVADVSGSMAGRPMATSIGLAIYFAERNKGDFHNLFMTFSGKSEIVELKGDTLFQKVDHIYDADWGMNTNLKSAFEKILGIAVKNHTRNEEMPKSMIVISDMEIDRCSDRDWTFYDEMADRYRQFGYEIPNIVFWNVNSRQNVFHADAKRKGVQLCSGHSTSVFKQLTGMIGKTPTEMMMEVINSQRYANVRIM